MDSAPATAAVAPVVMVTNDDGIDAPGLRFLVDQLVAAGRFRVLVCAPDKELPKPNALSSQCIAGFHSLFKFENRVGFEPSPESLNQYQPL
ncbi:hypothetical protein GUJ93_ZPchr0007g3079 [Zizania palustris]|uniref:Survival protein SurE-like phosphatase/nucleotidase domain-containing protein n=1 Tax=Zizania palustris TaxID=103762 RepID=A0A8J5TE19_ZIZPA|nr:hypothetical protein GUJ93_ZPchr0007g3079 [Zizania palustris]